MWALIRSLLFGLSPEAAHRLAFLGLRMLSESSSIRQGLASRLRVDDPALEVEIWGRRFPNPVGLAAGFDKNAHLLPMWYALGFGFAEMGTITPGEQEGNPRPRLFRLIQDEALINRMGFNNEGMAAIRERLLHLLQNRQWPAFPVGINLGKNKVTTLEKAVDDYVAVLDAFVELGDYFVVNVSSPNTPGLRQLQDKSKLDELLAAVQARNRERYRFQPRPLLVKVAPDLEWAALDDVLELCQKHGLSGIVATNTTLSREGLRSPLAEEGGLSGRPLRKRSTEMIQHIWKVTAGKLPIVGVGGIFSAEDAYEKIRAGASLVQVYTGFVYRGPTLIRKINRGLLHLLQKDGWNHISQAVGVSL